MRFALAFLIGCGNDISVTSQARCDGVKQQGEDTVDQPFDVDQDGAYDAANPDCSNTYAVAFLDCDDADAAIRPGAVEVGCNGVDDDCSATTPDGEDVDGDGYSACDDCADGVAEVNPGAVEVSCNELDDDCDVATPDGEDADGDGATACLDCNDSNSGIGPGATEVVCNFMDDDCSAETPDGADADGDGWTQCDDCDDLAASAYPGATEICDNAVDDDCDGDIDDGCVSDYSDTWTLDASVEYECAVGNVTIDFDRLLVTDAMPDITVDALGAGIQPGEMSGAFTSSTDFSVEQVLRGSCNEIYTLQGTFTDIYTFEGTFTAEYAGSFCLDCTDQTWTVSGSR